MSAGGRRGFQPWQNVEYSILTCTPGGASSGSIAIMPASPEQPAAQLDQFLEHRRHLPDAVPLTSHGPGRRAGAAAWR